ncbi:MULTISPECIES: DUF6086 family protein [unclassified Streptomyces]|uniref:DUF6086 family protein n=1 Tax=unclassified Streptomyces TaxID=2593676 RepID=UPI0033B6D1ED
MPGRVIWCPEAEVAHAFKGSSDVYSGLYGTSSGVGQLVAGECVIDFRDFRKFSEVAVDRFTTSDQGILRSLSLGFIATALVLIDRAGHPTPAMPGPAQELAWRTLRNEHARAMPV